MDDRPGGLAQRPCRAGHAEGALLPVFQLRKQFGFHLFGRDNQFGGAEKYTLEPLRELGEQALNVLDVPGIQWVRLTELRYLKNGPEPAVMTCASEDVFAHMRSTGGPIQPEWVLKRATFKVRFDDNPIPRSVTVKPSNVALYSRDADATAVEEWLTRRGFIQQEMICGSEQQEEAVAPHTQRS